MVNYDRRFESNKIWPCTLGFRVGNKYLMTTSYTLNFQETDLKTTFQVYSQEHFYSVNAHNGQFPDTWL